MMGGSWSQGIWMVAYAVVVSGLALFSAHRLFLALLFWRHRRRVHVPQDGWDEWPLVTVQLPLYNEVFVAERLLEAVRHLDYPRLHIQILDDSTDGTTAICERLAREIGAEGFSVEHLRRQSRLGYKAGALREGLARVQGGFICIFDADFVPPPNFLRRVMPAFANSRVGMVQARWGHLNESFSWLTRVQALLLDGHFVVEHTARSRSGRFFNFNGTAGVWRVECIRDAGGWEGDTLTEDLDLSYRAQLAGWKFCYLPEVVVPAELPITLEGFKAQQHRWAQGSIQTFRKLIPRIWRSRIGFSKKLEATAHLGANMAYLLLAAFCVLVFPGWGFEGDWWRFFLVMDMPIFLFSLVSLGGFYLTAILGREEAVRWRRVFWLPGVIALGMALAVNNGRAVCAGFLRRPSAFRRTPKYGEADVSGSAWSERLRFYRSEHGGQRWVEAALALYFCAITWEAWQQGWWVALPFFALFTSGFSLAAWGAPRRAS